MEITGTIIHIGETQTVGSAGTFKKRQLVVETDEQYKQQIPIDFVQDKTSVLDQYQVGNQVVVGINIRGNEYNGKWYCSLNGWKITKQGASQEPQSAVNQYQSQSAAPQYPDAPKDSPFGLNNNLPTNTSPAQASNEGDDDLPF